MLLNTDAQQIYTMYGGRVKVVSGTMVVNIAMNIGYAKLFSVEQLKNWFGTDHTTTRLSVKTYNGDSAAQEVHFYAPEIWNGEIFQYFYMCMDNISTQLLPPRIQTSLRNSRKLQTAGMRLFRKT